MKELICEMCGSNNVIKQDGLFVCQSCNTKYSIEEAKKIMFGETVEVTGTVKIDHSSELDNLYKLARRARDNNNMDDAYQYYKEILLKDPNNWEPQFYTAYYKATKTSIGNISLAAKELANTIATVFNMVKGSITDENEISKILIEITSKVVPLGTVLFNAAKRHYDGINSRIKDKFVQEYVSRGSNVVDLLYNLGNMIIEVFGEKYSDLSVTAWKAGVSVHTVVFDNYAKKDYHAKLIFEYCDKISKYDSSFERPKLKKGLFGHY